MEAIATQDEFFKYDPLIKTFYFKNQSIFEHPSLSLELDDVLQEMRIIIIKAIPNYDATKGASLTTYLYMHLTDRLKDLRSKILRRVKHHAGFYEDLTHSNQAEDVKNPDYMLDYLIFKHQDGDRTQQESMADLVDVKIIMENMKEADRELFIDRYIGGYDFRSLHKRHNRSFTHLNKRLRRIDKIFETLRFQEEN